MAANESSALISLAERLAMLLDAYTVTAPDGSTYLLPLVAQKKRMTNVESLYNGFAFIEIIILVLTLFVITHLGVNAWKFKVIHKNILILALYEIGLYILSIFARFALIAYESALIPLEGFYAFPFPQLIFVRNLSLSNMLMFFLLLIIERVAATVFVYDYEHNQRLYISIVLNLILFVFAFVILWAIIFAHLNFLVIIFLCLIVNAVSFVLYRKILKHNMNKLALLCDCLDRSHLSEYTLSLRVQINENIKTMQTIKFAASCLILHMTIVLPLIFLPAVFFSQPENLWLLDVFTSVANALMPAGIFCVLLVFFMSFPQLRKYYMPRSWRICLFGSRKVAVDRLSQDEASEEHFTILSAQWDLALTRVEH